MPVAPRDSRSRMLAIAGLVLGLGGLVYLLLAVTGAGRFDPETSPLRPADAEFNVGDAEARAEAIERDRTPLLFQDPAASERPIWVNHIGDDPATDWFAFAATVDGCVVEWNIHEQAFFDCNGVRYPPDGLGLAQYQVRVEDGEVIVDLQPEEPTTGSSIPESGD